MRQASKVNEVQARRKHRCQNKASFRCELGSGGEKIESETLAKNERGKKRERNITGEKRSQSTFIVTGWCLATDGNISRPTEYVHTFAIFL